ncbi:MAG: hypothetical protein Q7S56_03020 [Nanoarchaeota archaeon]|nr:hypothetical protein [Nanoarchaeota archaeon]
MVNPKTQIVPVPWAHTKLRIAIVVILGAFITLLVVFYIIGSFNIRNSNARQSNVREFPEKWIVGELYIYNFSSGLSSLLYPNGIPEDALYNFYLGSGSLPAGLILGLDGVLKGTPTGKGSTFEICIKDVDENSACETYLINTNYAEADIPDESVDNNIPVVDDTTKPASVTINNGSCVISNNGYIDIPKTMCQVGGSYAKAYEIKVSGSMTGPVGTVFSFGENPQIPDLADESFSCGGWEKDKIMHYCTRKVNSNFETAQWSLIRYKIAGEMINVNPNMQVIINASVRNETRMWETEANAIYTISCPKIDYCSLVKS